MNWLGALLAPRVRWNDAVLDLGCGILQPFGGKRLPCLRHVCVDTFCPYLDKLGPPALQAALPGAVDAFADGSFDVVLLLDVVEHLDKPDALAAIAGAERIARREVVVFTPDGPCKQDGFDYAGLGYNPAQAHRCSFTFDELAAMGYACTRHRNGTLQVGAITSVLGVKVKT
jgi:hypothetical protein